MNRREFLGVAAAGAALAQNKKDEVIATATQDTTPRVSIVLSSFKEGQDHDGTKLPGLADPQPPGADLTSAQVEAMTIRAIELAATRGGDFASTLQFDDWIVIKTHIGSVQPYVPGSVTDPRLVRAALAYLLQNKKGLRYTVVERASDAVWRSDFGGAFGGLSYRTMLNDMAQRRTSALFELVDLDAAETIELPVPGVAGRSYAIPKILQQCDRVISIAPLATDAAAGVALSMHNYLGFTRQSKAGTPAEVIVDVFSYKPADLAMVGGCYGVEGDGSASVHHNLILAGAKAPCVDAVAATLMGFKPAELPFLTLADKRGFGTNDVDTIWTRGNELEQARRTFRRASGVSTFS